MTPPAGTVYGDAFAVLVGQAVMLAASLAVQALLGWQLLPSGRGDYAVLAVVGTLLPTLCVLGLDRAVQYQLMSSQIDRGTALGALTAIGILGVGGASLLVAALSTAGWLPQMQDKRDAASLTIVLLALGSLAHTFTLRMHVAVRAYRNYLLATLLQSIVSVAGLLVALMLLDGGVTGALLALAASYICAAAISLQWLARGAGRWALLPSTLRRDALAFGARFYPALVGHAIDFNAGTLVLASMAASSEVGIYAAVSALMLRFLMLAQALQEALLPRIAADAAARTKLVAQMVRLATGVTAVAVACFLLASEWIIGLLLSPAFLAGVALAWWLGPGIVAHAASTVLMSHFEGGGRPGVVSLATWVGLSVNVAGLVVLYPLMGLSGAGLAMSAGLGARLAVLVASFLRAPGTSLTQLFVPSRGDADLARMAFQAVRGKVRPA